MLHLVITYDIADDGRRERLATLLSAYGPRVQLSVFECQVPTTTAARELRARIREVIDGVEDQVRVYRLSQRRPTRSLCWALARLRNAPTSGSCADFALMLWR